VTSLPNPLTMPGIPANVQKELDAFHTKQAKAAFEASDADKVRIARASRLPVDLFGTIRV